MTAQTLHDSTILHVLSATMDTLPVDPNRDPQITRAQREATAAGLAALRPRDAIEAMFAGRAIAAHHAAMECFRRAAQPDVSDEVGMRLLGKAVALSRLVAEQIRALERRQATARSAIHDRQPKVTAAGPRPAGTAPEPDPVAAAGLRSTDPMPSERPPAPPDGRFVGAISGVAHDPMPSGNPPLRLDAAAAPAAGRLASTLGSSPGGAAQNVPAAAARTGGRTAQPGSVSQPAAMPAAE